MKLRPISEIAHDVEAEWGKQKSGVYFGARPYLNAMFQLGTCRDNFYADGGDEVVRYFLANATTFRGERAKVLKGELKAHLKAVA